MTLEERLQAITALSEAIGYLRSTTKAPYAFGELAEKHIEDLNVVRELIRKELEDASTATTER